MSKVELGDRVRDMVTGIEGIVTSTSQWLTGCDRVSVQPPAKDGKMADSYWVDAHAVEILEKKAVKIESPSVHVSRGGPPTKSPR